MVKEIKLSQRKGAYKIEAKVLMVGEDIVVLIWGGPKPHVGAVALAVPRPSLKNSTKISATSSVLTRLGHKEDEIVKRVSESISGALNKVVVVSAGIHWDDIPNEDIRIIQSVCDELTHRMISEILKRGI